MAVGKGNLRYGRCVFCSSSVFLHLTIFYTVFYNKSTYNKAIGQFQLMTKYLHILEFLSKQSSRICQIFRLFLANIITNVRYPNPFLHRCYHVCVFRVQISHLVTHPFPFFFTLPIHYFERD